MSAAATRARHLAALLVLSAVAYLPDVLRAPTQSAVNDELFHLQAAHDIARLGTTAIPVTLYPIPGDYPGIEFLGLAISGATGLSIFAAARIAILVTHASLTLLAYVVASGIGLPRRGTFLAGALFAASASYAFMHTMFSYESLGIVFYAAIWAVLARDGTGGEPRPRAELALLGVLAAAVVVTHHVSSVIVAGSLLVYWLAALALGRWRAERGVLVVGLGTALAIAVWMLGIARFADRYLLGNLVSRFDAILKVGSSSGLRAPVPGAARAGLPVYEALMVRLWVALLGLLVLLVAWQVVRRRLRLERPAVVALLVVGPAAWSVGIPLVLGPANDVGLRSLGFSQLGLAVVGAAALLLALERPRRLRRVVSWPLYTALASALIVLAFPVNDHQGGRFPTTTPRAAAGPGALTADVLDAASWSTRYAGPYNLTAADAGTGVGFAVYGSQDTGSWGAWLPFTAPTPQVAARAIAEKPYRLVVVDRRITRLPPRYDGYWGKAERFARNYRPYSPSGLFPAPLLDKLDRVPGLARAYDDGDIQVYATRDAGRR